MDSFKLWSNSEFACDVTQYLNNQLLQGVVPARPYWDLASGATVPIEFTLVQRNGAMFCTNAHLDVDTLRKPYG
jgi:hypothetical protein